MRCLRSPEFTRGVFTKYHKELRDKKDLICKIQDREKENGTVTLLYSAKDDRHNQAVALIGFLKSTR